MREFPEQQMIEVPTGRATGVPEQQAEVNPERWVEEILEQQAEQRPTVEEVRPPPKSTGVDPTAAPKGSGRHR